MVNKEELLKFVEEKNIKLTDEQLGKLETCEELTKDELDAVTGGCGSVWWPDDPTCPVCHGHNTYSKWVFPNKVLGFCRVCKTPSNGEVTWEL